MSNYLSGMIGSKLLSQDPFEQRAGREHVLACERSGADLDSYLKAKLKVFANQGNDDVAVFNADDPALAGTDLGGCARRIAFTRTMPSPSRAREESDRDAR